MGLRPTQLPPARHQARRQGPHLYREQACVRAPGPKRQNHASLQWPAMIPADGSQVVFRSVSNMDGWGQCNTVNDVHICHACPSRHLGSGSGGSWRRRERGKGEPWAAPGSRSGSIAPEPRAMAPPASYSVFACSSLIRLSDRALALTSQATRATARSAPLDRDTPFVVGPCVRAGLAG